MSAVEMIEDLGTAAPVVGERSAEEAGRVALGGDSDGNIEVVASRRVGGVVVQREALLLPPSTVRSAALRSAATNIFIKPRFSTAAQAFQLVLEEMRSN